MRPKLRVTSEVKYLADQPLNSAAREDTTVEENYNNSGDDQTIPTLQKKVPRESTFHSAPRASLSPKEITQLIDGVALVDNAYSSHTDNNHEIADENVVSAITAVNHDHRQDEEDDSSAGAQSDESDVENEAKVAGTKKEGGLFSTFKFR